MADPTTVIDPVIDPVPDPLVDVDWLRTELAGPDADRLRILDCTVHLLPRPEGGLRVHSGREDWEAGHVPGSSFVDLQGDLSDPDAPLRFTLPSPDHFAAALGRLGVGSEHRVVLYDRRASMWAARVWWMLRAFGHDDAVVLDGGWTAWVASGGEVSTTAPGWPPATFIPRPRPGLFVGRDDVVTAIDDPTTCVVNALDRAQHRGETTNYARPGRIPGSANVPALELVDAATQRYRPLEELRTLFAEVDGSGAGRVITYCGGGIAASSDAFTLHRLGRRDVAVYDNSLNEWAADPSLPLEV